MDYLYLFLKVYFILYFLIIVSHDLINKIFKLNYDSAIFIFFFCIINIIMSPLKGPLIILMLPFPLFNNILSMFQEKYLKHLETPLTQDYCEYFKYEIDFSKETLNKLEVLLKENNIKYKKKYLVNISSYFLKSLHVINLTNDVSLNKKEEIITLFSERLNISFDLANKIFEIIEKELLIWIDNNKDFNN